MGFQIEKDWGGIPFKEKLLSFKREFLFLGNMPKLYVLYFKKNKKNTREYSEKPNTHVYTYIFKENTFLKKTNE